MNVFAFSQGPPTTSQVLSADTGCEIDLPCSPMNDFLTRGMKVYTYDILCGEFRMFHASERTNPIGCMTRHGSVEIRGMHSESVESS